MAQPQTSFVGEFAHDGEFEDLAEGVDVPVGGGLSGTTKLQRFLCLKVDGQQVNCRLDGDKDFVKHGLAAKPAL